MKTYTIFDRPIKVYGVPFFEEQKRLARLPDSLIAQLPQLEKLGRRCAGGRAAFKTDSPFFHLKVTLKTLEVDIGMSLYSCQGVQVMVGERANARHAGTVAPADYSQLVFEKTFYKSPELEQVTLYFPRNEILENIEISVEDDALVTVPTPYKHEKPVLFYGSSITEGGCACNSTNAYNAMLSRWLDFDYYNLGFSGCALGELIMADYINTFDMGVFVYDYDHNAPTVAHLAQTHKPFFDRIRQVHPDLPVIMMTRPAEIYDREALDRREVVLQTYRAAVESGDRNVYFIDGETFYGEKDRNLCSFDQVHPNDIGFYRMATTIRPVLEGILKEL